jgi:MSHA pilin protein MshA
MTNIKNAQCGFTLIELVVSVTLVGILSVVALPKIMGVTDDARQATLDAVAGTLTSFGANNYIERSSNATQGFAMATCGAAVALLDSGALPAGFAFGASASTVAVDVKTTCTIVTTTTPLLTSNFDAYGV